MIMRQKKLYAITNCYSNKMEYVVDSKEIAISICENSDFMWSEIIYLKFLNEDTQSER